MLRDAAVLVETGNATMTILSIADLRGPGLWGIASGH